MKWSQTQDYRIKKRGDVYWARFSKNGERVQVSLKTKNFLFAKALADEIEAEMLSGRGVARGGARFMDAWRRFLEAKKTGNRVRIARPKTLYEYESFGERYYIQFFKNMKMSAITPEMWIEFLDWVKTRHGSIKIFNIRKYFLVFLNWAKSMRLIREVPFLLNPDQDLDEEPKARVISQEEFDRILAHSGSSSFRLYLLMARYMGMRPSEITQLKKSRVDISNMVIELRSIDTKTARPRVVPIHQSVIDDLKLAMTQGDSEYLFPNQRDSSRPMDRTGFKKAWARATKTSQVHARPYDLRHTFITRAIMSGVSPSVVAKITGTSARVIEKHYLHVMPKDLHRALQAVDFFGSR